MNKSVNHTHQATEAVGTCLQVVRAGDMVCPPA